MNLETLLPAGLTCFVLRGGLSAAECADLVQRAETLGFEPTAESYPKAYRCNDRLVLDDPALASWLWQRFEASLPALSNQRPIGLNPRFRFCRYRDGQSFCLHRDGAWSPTATTRTRLTLQIYLNDGSEFVGGATTFSEGGLAVRPERGMVIVFEHRLWHAGEAVPKGTKYVLRSDVIYPLPTQATDSHPPEGLLERERFDGHTGYVWQALPLRDGRIASGSRDGTVRVWPSGEVLRREPSSVVALAEKLDGTLVHGTRAQGVLCLATLPDGAVASGMTDGTLRLGERSLPISEGWIWCAVPTGPGHLALGCESGALIEVDVKRREITSRVQLPAPVRALAHTGDATLLAGLADGQLWHAGTLRAAHTGAITGIAAVGPRMWATSSEDCSIAVWDADTSAPLATARHDDFVRSIAIAARELVTASYDCSVRRWALAT